MIIDIHFDRIDDDDLGRFVVTSLVTGIAIFANDVRIFDTARDRVILEAYFDDDAARDAVLAALPRALAFFVANPRVDTQPD